MNFLKVARRDISSIFKNRLIRVSVVAIVIVPLLYSLLYLAAFWDPYNRLSSMPIAVVNLDRGSLNDGKMANYGNEIVDKLKKDNRVGWRFVSKEKAENGVKSKKGYYAMFLIPSDFSKNVLSAKDGTPKEAKILFQSNDKKNFLASQINSKVLLELKQEVTKNIVNEYTKVVFENLYDVKNAMKKAENGSKKLNSGIEIAKNGSQELSNGLSKLTLNMPKLNSGINSLYTGSGSLTNGLKSAQIGVAKLYDGVSQLSQGLGELSSKAPTLGNGVGKLYAGSQNLSSGLKNANEGLINKILPGSQAIADGLSKLSTGLAGAGDGSNKLVSAASTLSSGSNNLNSASSLITQSQQALSLGVTKQGGLLDSTSILSDGAYKLSNGSKELQGGFSQVINGANDLKNASFQAANGVDTLVDNMNKSQEILKNSVATELGAYLKSNPNAYNDPNMKKFIATLNNLNNAASDEANIAQVTALQSGVHKLANGTGNLSEGINKLSSGVSLYAQSANQYSQGAVGFSQGASQFSEGASNYVKGITAYTQGANQYSQGANQFAQGAVAFGTGTSEAVKGSETLSIGAIALNKALKGEFATGMSELNNGSSQLTSGLKDADENIPSLISGINKINAGAYQIKNNLGSDVDRSKVDLANIDSASQGNLLSGMNQLYDGSIKLNNGLSTLHGNIPALAVGVTKLNNGSISLKNGMIKLANGSKELWNKINDGFNELNNKLKVSSSKMGEYVSQPVGIIEKPINPVKNYGTGFTPYFIPLSLWVGAIMMFFVISDKTDESIKTSSTSLVIGKYISYAFIGIIQAVLASTAVLFLGLKPDNIVLYYMFNIFMSFVFIAIMQSLIFLLGQAGRLLSIVLLIIQLTSCAGTFPLEVVPKFFKVLNPFMPFTYCVSALREIISGIDYNVLRNDVMFLAAVMIGFLFISVVMKKHADKIKVIIEQKNAA